MKNPKFQFSLIFLFVSLFAYGQTTQSVRIQNESDNCDLYYTVICTVDDCENVTGGPSGILGAGQSIPVSCGGAANFAGLRFSYPDGDNVPRYITFHHDLDNECAGIEDCNALYTWQHQGIESFCLGPQEEVRADYFVEFDECVIYFSDGN